MNSISVFGCLTSASHTGSRPRGYSGHRTEGDGHVRGFLEALRIDERFSLRFSGNGVDLGVKEVLGRPSPTPYPSPSPKTQESPRNLMSPRNRGGLFARSAVGRGLSVPAGTVGVLVVVRAGRNRREGRRRPEYLRWRPTAPTLDVLVEVERPLVVGRVPRELQETVVVA